FFFFSSRRRHTSFSRDWSSDVCSSDLIQQLGYGLQGGAQVAADFLIRNGIQLGDDAAHLLLQSVEAAGNGGYHNGFLARIESNGFGVREKIQRHVLLSSQNIGRSNLAS